MAHPYVSVVPVVRLEPNGKDARKRQMAAADREGEPMRSSCARSWCAALLIAVAFGLVVLHKTTTRPRPRGFSPVSPHAGGAARGGGAALSRVTAHTGGHSHSPPFFAILMAPLALEPGTTA